MKPSSKIRLQMPVSGVSPAIPVIRVVHWFVAEVYSVTAHIVLQYQSFAAPM